MGDMTGGQKMHLWNVSLEKDMIYAGVKKTGLGVEEQKLDGRIVAGAKKICKKLKGLEEPEQFWEEGTESPLIGLKILRKMGGIVRGSSEGIFLEVSADMVTKF